MTGAILIVEDDTDIAELMRLYIERDGFQARIVGSGEDARAALSEAAWDLVLLDINLPGTDGFELLQEIRRTSQIPVIIVTARQEESDAVYGLGAGADEYVTKPFSPRVLVARVRALLRRWSAGTGNAAVADTAADADNGAAAGSQAAGAKAGTAADADNGHSNADGAPAAKHASATDNAAGAADASAGTETGSGPGYREAQPRRVRIGEVEVNLETEQVYREGAEIRLAPKEYALLRYLIERAGRPATPSDIYAAVWHNEYGDLSSVAVHVQRLRRKVERNPSEPACIVTRHGYGYALGVSPEVVA